MPKAANLKASRQSPATGEKTKSESKLLRSLVHATYWVDDALQAHMLAEAGMSLPRAQSMLMVYLTEGVNRQLDLAAHLRVSKQAIRQGIKELESKGIVHLVKDPDSGRQKLVELTDHGRQLGVVAADGIRHLERVLTQRLGSKAVADLHRVLDANWGEVPQQRY